MAYLLYWKIITSIIPEIWQQENLVERTLWLTTEKTLLILNFAIDIFIGFVTRSDCKICKNSFVYTMISNP